MIFYKHEVSQLSIVIHPPDVEVNDNTSPNLYLFSSMGSVYWDSFDISYCDSIEPSSMNTSVSTSINVTFISHMSHIIDDVYVNLVSHEYVSGSSSSSCVLSSSSPPIFHSDEDMMEDMTTPDYPYYNMHHHVYFLPQQTHDQYVLEYKESIHGEYDWFKNPNLTLDDFEEGNMGKHFPYHQNQHFE